MHPIISNQTIVSVTHDIAYKVSDALLYSSLNRDEEFDKHPYHLVKVAVHRTLGVMVKLLCDVRVYKYVYEQEQLLEQLCRTD
jgi:hypothetical protein